MAVLIPRISEEFKHKTNVDHSNKVLWWATDRCASRYTHTVLHKAGAIFAYNDSVGQFNHGYSCEDGCEEYTIICQTRHPAARLLSHYFLAIFDREDYKNFSWGKGKFVEWEEFFYNHLKEDVEDEDVGFELLTPVNSFYSECKERCTWWREPDLLIRAEYLDVDIKRMAELIPTLNFDLTKVKSYLHTDTQDSGYSSKNMFNKKPIMDYYTPEMLLELYESNIWNDDYILHNWGPTPESKY